MGFKVLADTSPNATPGNAAVTFRLDLIEVEPLQYAGLKQILELEPRLVALEQLQIDKVVFAVLGGVPGQYFSLARAWQRSGTTVAALKGVANSDCGRLLAVAMGNRDRVLADKSCAGMASVYERFHKSHGVPPPRCIPEAILKQGSVARPSPDKVLRSITRQGPDKTVLVLEPCDAATELVLRFNLTEESSTDLDHLASLLDLNCQPEGQEMR